MRTIITFLNNKGLMPGSVYTWQGEEYEGGVFSLALRQFVEHDHISSKRIAILHLMPFGGQSLPTVTPIRCLR